MAGELLLLFDIDGTLVSGATEAHRDAMHEALRAVHGVDADQRDAARSSAAGRTDPEIARAILLDAGISAERIDDRADDVREECCRAYARLCPDDLSGTVLPGSAELLERLSARARVRLGLLTGNYELVARLKLGAGRDRPLLPERRRAPSDRTPRIGPRCQRSPAAARARWGPRTGASRRS